MCFLLELDNAERLLLSHGLLGLGERTCLHRLPNTSD